MNKIMKQSKHLLELPAQCSLHFVTLIPYAVGEQSSHLIKCCLGEECQGEPSPAPTSPRMFSAGEGKLRTTRSPVSVGLMTYVHSPSGKENVIKTWPLLSKSIYCGPIIITTHIWNCFAIWKALSHPLAYLIFLIMLWRMCHHYPTFYRWGKWTKGRLGNLLGVIWLINKSGLWTESTIFEDSIPSTTLCRPPKIGDSFLGPFSEKGQILHHLHHLYLCLLEPTSYHSGFLHFLTMASTE